MVLCTQQSQTPQCASQAKLSSVVQYTPRSKVIKIAQKALGCASHRGAESSSAVCFPPWSQAPGCASHRRVKIKIFVSLYVVAFKGTIRRNPFNPIRYCWGPFGPTPTLTHNRLRIFISTFGIAMFEKSSKINHSAESRNFFWM